jgi:nucleotide-binding universal stress UspA family protein
MAAVIRPGWSKPRTILLASEIPANKKVFALALAQAVKFGAELILFHAYDTLGASASETSRTRSFDYASAARFEMQHLEPQAQEVREAGVPCEIVVRPGLAADQILTFLSEREVDRIVMGTRSPGPVGKLLFGSVAEAVLRTAKVPVCVVGPNAVGGARHNFAPRTILCAVSFLGSRYLLLVRFFQLTASCSVVYSQQSPTSCTLLKEPDKQKRPSEFRFKRTPARDVGFPSEPFLAPS